MINCNRLMMIDLLYQQYFFFLSFQEYQTEQLLLCMGQQQN